MFSDYQTENVLSIDYVSRRYANIEHHGVIYLICLISAVFITAELDSAESLIPPRSLMLTKNSVKIRVLAIQ